MTRRDDWPRDESPWYCPGCGLWVGWKRDRCSCGQTIPRLPLRYDDVDTDNSFEVTRWDRLKAKLGWFR